MYNKTNWVDGVTPMSAEHLNNLENGLNDIINYSTHVVTSATLATSSWVSLNGQYYIDHTDSWFTGAAKEVVDVFVIPTHAEQATVLTGAVETFSGKIRIWAYEVPSSNITVNYKGWKQV